MADAGVAGDTATRGDLLVVESLTAQYPGGAKALHGIDLAVPRDAVIGLLGANGAGKTTTLKAISGGLDTAGSIRFDGSDLKGQPYERTARGIAHVPEGRQVYAGLSVKENLQLGAFGKQRGLDDGRDDIELVLEVFPELEKHLNRSGAWLSGGEQQMVAIGRAMVARPKLMLLDEPTMGLAPIIVERLQEVIRSGMGASILLAEENVTFATSVTSQCHVLQAGRIAWSGLSGQISQDLEIQSLLLR